MPDLDNHLLKPRHDRCRTQPSEIRHAIPRSSEECFLALSALLHCDMMFWNCRPRTSIQGRSMPQFIMLLSVSLNPLRLCPLIESVADVGRRPYTEIRRSPLVSRYRSLVRVACAALLVLLACITKWSLARASGLALPARETCRAYSSSGR